MIKSSNIIVGDTIVEATATHTFTNTDPYTWVSATDIADGKNQYLVHLTVKDNLNSVSFYKLYFVGGYYLNRVSAEGIQLIASIGLEDAIIDVTIDNTYFDQMHISASPSPSNVKIELRIEKLRVSENVLYAP